MVDVVYPAGWFHVERDRVELFGMVHERIDQLPLTTADADTIVRKRHMLRNQRLMKNYKEHTLRNQRLMPN